MLQPVFTKQFKRDAKKAQRQGRNMDKLKDIIRKLLNQERLPLRNRDHNLTSEYAERRECHIEPDWLLIYKHESEIIIFERLGTHSELFT